MRYEKSCGAVVYTFHQGYPFYLLEYMQKGHVSIPKGHVEENETEEETAVREIREETGLEVKLDTVFRHEISYSPEEGVEKTVVFFMAYTGNLNTTVQESEVREIKWLPWSLARQEITHESDREVLEHAEVYLRLKYYGDYGLDDLNPGHRFLLYREHAVDIHSHIIPGADDGAQTDQERDELLRLDREEGIQWVFATPHYGIENGYAPERSMVGREYKRLSEDLLKSRSPVKALLGTEWYCSDHIVERIRNQEAFPMGNSDWYMVEFLEWGGLTEDAETMLRRLKKMKDHGIKTILAHPERYKAIQQNRDLAKRICDLDVLLQVNAYDLFLNPKDATRNLAQWMAKEKLISFIGSDMHGTGVKPNGKPKRRPQMKEGVSWLYDNVDDEYANDIVRVNAEKYLGVDNLLK